MENNYFDQVSSLCAAWRWQWLEVADGGMATGKTAGVSSEMALKCADRVVTGTCIGGSML